MRTARELPRKSPVPMAPPIAIMLSWAEVSWRWSCSPCSMRPGEEGRSGTGLIFIRRAGATGGVEGAEQLDRGSPQILDAVAHAHREINAVAGTEIARFLVRVNDAVAFQNKDAFFVGVVMERSLAGRNPAGELRDLAAAEVGVDEITECAILAGANRVALVFMDDQAARRGRARVGRIDLMAR